MASTPVKSSHEFRELYQHCFIVSQTDDLTDLSLNSGKQIMQSLENIDKLTQHITY